MIAAPTTSLNVNTGVNTSNNNSDDVRQLIERYQAAGQSHLFNFYEDLNDDDKATLVSQLEALNVERVNRIHQKATTCPSPMLNNQSATLAPLPEECFDSILEASKDKTQEWRTIGLNQISQNKVAVILLAGGQGTRLGSSAPKGCYDINLPSNKSLFQIQAERIFKLQQLAQQQPGAVANVTIPWYVMTSGPTRPATVAFFQENNYFGLSSDNIVFFEQGTLPCLTFDGKIMMESKSQIAVAPDGNGGVYAALRGTGVLANMAERKIEYLHAYCVDNCLVRVADPVFIGYCVSKNADCGAKVVRKNTPDEPVGVVCLRNAAFNVVEYSEIDEDVAHAINPKNGQLLYSAANIVNHFYTTDFLNKVESFEGDLEYHIARKKIKTIDMQTGDIIAPKQVNGMKLEMFVFDVFPFTERMAVFEVDRREEFSPLKNAPGTGVDCPETSRRDILQQNVRFFEAAGGKVVVGEDDNQVEGTPTLELSPLVTYSGEGLAEIVAGKSIKTPIRLHSLEELKRAVF
ncbi:UDP-N-acetylglucosamine pyrophosphorylase [Linnemannia elongata]|uniref:UDP-N-acetylglucosamine diphosphorylase n=1 Tax=Linnemannia elongata AG-77 TaxID=1314771 RepID=A0A197JEI1_9FUNG|nr:UDP-N-acetylglucosamine pyrophosphorylase [Linnemannia elongata]KAG0063059.1 UDP-N-acetylglucosamine pyrophosphorylase [Linnemannia elongata]KAG0068003.1 UDP-N-acetylglucosamine pyrophosphorylase [Linnemannia elongata]KAK5797164.1 nucleotide-diphospho-sugar transferase [Linnemannia elongata]OAQ23557.1 nucleotide-diphospho-sugar transferase [Linnemannia elongata AG-77]